MTSIGNFVKSIRPRRHRQSEDVPDNISNRSEGTEKEGNETALAAELVKRYKLYKSSIESSPNLMQTPFSQSWLEIIAACKIVLEGNQRDLEFWHPRAGPLAVELNSGLYRRRALATKARLADLSKTFKMMERKPWTLVETIDNGGITHAEQIEGMLKDVAEEISALLTGYSSQLERAICIRAPMDAVEDQKRTSPDASGSNRMDTYQLSPQPRYRSRGHHSREAKNKSVHDSANGELAAELGYPLSVYESFPQPDYRAINHRSREAKHRSAMDSGGRGRSLERTYSSDVYEPSLRPDYEGIDRPRRVPMIAPVFVGPLGTLDPAWSSYGLPKESGRYRRRPGRRSSST